MNQCPISIVFSGAKTNIRDGGTNIPKILDNLRFITITSARETSKIHPQIWRNQTPLFKTIFWRTFRKRCTTVTSFVTNVGRWTKLCSNNIVRFEVIMGPPTYPILILKCLHGSCWKLELKSRFFTFALQLSFKGFEMKIDL